MLRPLVSVICVCFLLVSLCACSAKEELSFTLTAFESEVTFQGPKENIKGVFTYNSPSDMTFTVSEPESIKGLCFKRTNGNMSVNIGEISLSPDMSNESGVFELFDAISGIAVSDITLNAREIQQVSLAVGDERCTLKVDGENQKLLAVSVKGYSYKFE